MKKRLILDEGQVTVNSLDGVRIDNLQTGSWYIAQDDRGYKGLKRLNGRKIKIIVEVQ